MTRLRLISAVCLMMLVEAVGWGQTSGSTTYYVTLDGKAVEGGWQTVTTLSDALIKAKAGDEIWIQGSESVNLNSCYTVPGEDGFKVKSGVSIYGGFKGTETSVAQRETTDRYAFKMRYRTVISGDINGDDAVNVNDFFFPENDTRSDNARHVLTLDMKPVGNSNHYPTVINGLTITGGSSTGSTGDDKDCGGGVYVTGNNTGGGVYRIEQCFIVANYANEGGGIYVAPEVKNVNNNTCLISRTAVFNNAASERKHVINAGGGIFMAGSGTIVNSVVYNNANGGVFSPSELGVEVKVINSTLTRNTSSGVDGHNITVANTVIWGNTTMFNQSNAPTFFYSAYSEAGDGDTHGNVRLDTRNNDANGPGFNSPSLKAGFDISYNVFKSEYPEWIWESLTETVLVDNGDGSRYDMDTFGSVDMRDNGRIKGGGVDIGAYEYQPAEGGRIRYVKPGGTGDGTSWADASGDLQKMIDELADNNRDGLKGEVWVAAGIYKPKTYLMSGKTYTGSFRMRNNVHVYGGFAGTEADKDERKFKSGGKPWDYTNETVLEGSYYSSGGGISWDGSGSSWRMTSDSRHVVWFAPLQGETFNVRTTLEGFTIRGGYARGGDGMDDFATDCGGGVYMGTAYAMVSRCRIVENSAEGNGGGVYMKGGRMLMTLVANNNAGDAGGAVFTENAGIALRCMLTNNSADNGAGVYLDNTGEYYGSGEHPEYLILSTCVVTNNTSRKNGAVYCNKGGVVLQSIIANNHCTTATDATDQNASQTGGLYADTYALVINSVLWNNRSGAKEAVDGKDVPMYAVNTNGGMSSVRFLYNAISGIDNAVWNNVLQEQTVRLALTNNTENDNASSIGPNFSHGGSMNVDAALLSTIGVQSGWIDKKGVSGIDYFWEPVCGSSLWRRGLEIASFPSEVIIAPEMDINVEAFSQKPSIGAYRVEVPALKYDATSDPDKLIIYVDMECVTPEHDGSSWEKAYRSIDTAISYLAGLSAEEVNGRELEVRVREGNVWLRYAFASDDRKSATLDILAAESGAKLRISGGWHATADAAGNMTWERNPLKYRTIINGNMDGNAPSDGIYHVVTVRDGANVELDGLHICGGYAAGTALLQSGAGMYIYGENTEVTVRNCIFENNTAEEYAAIFNKGEEAMLTLQNCVINNNTNLLKNIPVLSAGDNLTMDHVTIVNNEASAPDDMGLTSFSAGNSDGNSIIIATEGKDGAVNFANPTKSRGATLGFDTWLGGYSEFRPLTSSGVAAEYIINKAASSSSSPVTDITTINGRDLGGTPDRGAYEALMPEKGKVIYVRDYGNTTEEGGDGSSWEKAINGNCVGGHYINSHGFQGYDAELYPENTLLTGLQWAVDEAYYRSLKKDAKGNIQYTEQQVYTTTTPTDNNSWKYENLKVSGIDDSKRVKVWIAEGEYLRRKGFFMRDGVDVSGGFPKDGNPGENNRDPRKYATIIETNTDTEVASGSFNGWGNKLSDKDYSGYGLIASDRSQWKIVDFSSQETEGEKNGNGLADKAIDNAESTFWHTVWRQGVDGHGNTVGVQGSSEEKPHYIVIDFGKVETVNSVYLKSRSYGFNNVSVFLENNNDFTASTAVASGEMNGGSTVEFNMNGRQGRYLKIAFWNPVGKDHVDLFDIYINQQNVGTTHDLNSYKYAYEGSRVLTQQFPYYYYDANNGVSNGGSPIGGNPFTNNIECPNIVSVGYKYKTTWDGFIIQNGRTRILHQRDGGAGLALRANGVVSNCIIRNNINSANSPMRGGGVFCNDGTLINCDIQNNRLESSGNDKEIYGGGIYIRSGVVFNNCITGNTCVNDYSKGGSGVFCEVGTFYNNTLSGNTGAPGLHSGNWFLKNGGGSETAKLYIFNSIVNDVAPIDHIIDANSKLNVTVKNCIFPKGTTLNEQIITEDNYFLQDNDLLFVDTSIGNYRLHNGSPAINRGDNDPDGVILPDYDADYKARIQNCAVDIGAYEFTAKDLITPELTMSEDGTTVKYATYYVTENGSGKSTGDSPQNAACKEELQAVLNKAGENKKKYPDAEVVVKVAGGTYNVTDLANPDDPQSYSFVIPYGVVLKGGYGELQGGNWNSENRNITEHPTYLSAKKLATNSMQEVNGYHTVTFAEKPDGWTGGDAVTIVDGVYIIDGAATSLAGKGNPNTMGGGAIVTQWAHVRNCVVSGNKALEGGGLYLQPGAMVSGCVVMRNEADTGGGIYADGTEVSEKNRAHVMSSTIVINTASAGGGIYHEAGSCITLNSVVWGNSAGVGKDISGMNNTPYDDDMLNKIPFKLKENTAHVDFWYPFNDCAIESIELPGAFCNMVLTSGAELYFGKELYRPKAYSVMIDHGAEQTILEYMQTNHNVSAYDMDGKPRIEEGKLADIGAFTYISPDRGNDKYYTRLFVAHDGSTLNQTNADYEGRSFYTPFTMINDAINYINDVRKNIPGAKNAVFEILVAAGTYKPKFRREDASSPDVDQRQNSYKLPYNVKLYGGFSGKEKYSSDDKFTAVMDETSNEPVTLDGKITIEEIIKAREHSDFNQNGLLEPWELANQTILSGFINEASGEKVYHIVYSDTDNEYTGEQTVTVDGVSFVNGHTLTYLSSLAANNELGRGGGIYSNGVNYNIANCRFLRNTAVRGGGIYLRDAKLKIVNTMFAGNEAIQHNPDENPNKGEAGSVEDPDFLYSSGGAVYVASNSSESSVYAANVLWVNNEAYMYGGALGADNDGTGKSDFNTTINLMNNTFAKNNARFNGAIYHAKGTNSICNTLFWGNEGESTEATRESLSASYSASDIDNIFIESNADAKSNLKIDTDNMSLTGPHIERPTTTAGVKGYDAMAQWNPVAWSVITDNGNGQMSIENESGTVTGGYYDWFNDNAPTYKDIYITSDRGYTRYSHHISETKTARIDIGVYEYQYMVNFQTMDAIYVATRKNGDGSGKDWANATDDLRGAFYGVSNPTQPHEKKTVYVKGGDYSWPKLSTGVAYSINPSSAEFGDWKDIVIKGACTGIGEGDAARQDFSSLTRITEHPYADGGKDTETTLLEVSPVNNVNITVEGFEFLNERGNGVRVSHYGKDENNKIALRNCSFVQNKDGIYLDWRENETHNGKMLIANTLFADNGAGLNMADASLSGNLTLVNTTFANNTADINHNCSNVYNTVAWKNKTTNIQETDGHNNKVYVIDTTVENTDILNGPNFADPDNVDISKRDYRIGPSTALLEKGSNERYKANVLGNDLSEIPVSESDLGGISRLIGDNVDIGAYEYGARLQRVIYVKKDVLDSNQDGTSWGNSTDNLQNAVDLAGLYHNNHSDETAYVFVHKNVQETGALNVRLTGVKIYGGMNDETTTTGENTDVDATVKALLGKRKGLIESDTRTGLKGGLTMSAASVVDGFEVSAPVTLTGGAMLSTSVVSGDVSDGDVSGKDGILYNTLVEGSVSGVQAVNVTATGNITGCADNSNIINCRSNVVETNPYVTSGSWKYQLKETSADINTGKGGIEEYIINVGHGRDIAGNKRVRNTVDNGCFETWSLPAGGEVTEEDYPRGLSVVYVRSNSASDAAGGGNELKIIKTYNAASPFNPGFLLLEHHAGLRGGKQTIALSNFAVERRLDDNGTDMTAMPFAVTKKEWSGEAGPTFHFYDAQRRAGYEYKFDSGNGAWIAADNQLSRAHIITKGWLVKGTPNTTVRYYGDYYTEDSNPKEVVLEVNNFSNSWTPASSGGNNFTHKENMSWNLFGSPYLCAMNYGDMEYGRVIYGYQNGVYVTVNTAVDITPQGYVPAGDAVFTQTATLQNEEKVKVAVPAIDGKSGTVYQNDGLLEVALAPAGTDTRSNADGTDDDRLMLNTVDTEAARDYFDMAEDGVKWTGTSGKPYIYATVDGGRYSLLSAVSREGTVSLGMLLPSRGSYTVYVPDGCDWSGYESVVLTDAVTGRSADLLAGPYTFEAGAAGEVEGRFMLRFKSCAMGLPADRYSLSTSRGTLIVRGLSAGDDIRVYTAAGALTATSTATGSEARIPLHQGTYIVCVNDYTAKVFVR